MTAPNLRMWMGRWSARAVVMALGVAGSLGAGPVPPPLSDVRVRSEATETIVEAWVGQAVPVQDRTQGSRDADVEAGALGHRISSGETFAEEIRLRLPDTPPSRSTSVIVGDRLVSEVRVLPARVGSTLVIFVRQPVRYDIVRVGGGTALRVSVRPATVAARPRGGRAVIPGRGDEREVTVDAETVRYDRQQNVIVASGGVAITRPGTSLTADQVRVNRETYDGEAAGNVVLRTEGSTVRGEYVRLNLADETGWIEQGEIDMPETGYLVSGERISKGFGQTYHAEHGVLTTCRCGGLEPPSWSIAARRLDVDLYGHGIGRDLTLRVRDVPVLYMPFGVFPVNRTRQSGFLMPRIGQSFGPANNRGFQYEQPFYWAISKSSDATIAFDIETAARVGGALEYRYALTSQSRGTIAGTYFNETLRTDEVKIEDGDVVEEPPTDRWGLFTDVRQRLPGDVRGYANTMLVSDDLFFTEIDSASFDPAEDEAERRKFYTASRIGALKAWDEASLWGEATFFQDLDIEMKNEDEAVLQRVPRLEFRAQHATLWDRVVLSFAGEGVDYQRRVGFDGLRLDLHPEVRVPFQIGRVLFGSVDAGLRETVYHLTNEELIENRCSGGRRNGQPCTSDDQCLGGGRCESSPTGELLDGDRTRETAHVGWRVGTEVSRVFSFRRWGLESLKHTIEPTVSYLFVPFVGGQDELPLFDGVDRVNRRSLFSYGVVSRLKARLRAGTTDAAGGEKSLPPAPSIREIARMSLLQVYDTEREIVGDDHESDIDFRLDLNPVSLLALRYGATYNVNQAELKGSSVSFSVREPWQPASPQLASLQRPSQLAISYRFVSESAGAGQDSGLEELGGALYLRLATFFGLLMQSRINLLEREVREVGVGVRFVSRCNCWMLEVGVDDRAVPEETVVRAQLTLAGIGSVGRAPGRGFVTVPGSTRWDH